MSVSVNALRLWHVQTSDLIVAPPVLPFPHFIFDHIPVVCVFTLSVTRPHNQISTHPTILYMYAHLTQTKLHHYYYNFYSLHVYYLMLIFAYFNNIKITLYTQTLPFLNQIQPRQPVCIALNFKCKIEELRRIRKFRYII